MAARRCFLALSRAQQVVRPSISQQGVVRTSISAVVQKRTFFGFGVPTAPLPAKQETPWYKRVAEDDYDEYITPISEEEKQERIALTEEILSFQDKGSLPDLDVYKRLVSMLIKWDDKEGVVNARNLAVEMGVTFDDQLDQQVAEYLEQANIKAWQ